MTRIAKADLHRFLDVAAQHISEAGGDDGKITFAELESKIDTLEGDEKELTSTFFRFVRHSNVPSGTTMTAEQLREAVQLAKANLIDAHDTNNNGLSSSEIESMGVIGQLAAKLVADESATGPGSRRISAKERALINDINDGGRYTAWEAYATFLTKRDNPHGEMIELYKTANRGGDGRVDAATDYDTKLDGLERRWLGPELYGMVATGNLKLEWERGYIKKATIGWDWDMQDEKVPEMLGKLLDLPEAQFIRDLRLGIPGEENDWAESLRVLADKGPLKSVRNLVIGEYDMGNELEISWAQIGMVPDLEKTLPNLLKLKIQGGSVNFENLDHAKLEELEIHSGGLDGAAARAISGADLPRMQDLELWLGTDEYGGNTSLSDLEGIFSGGKLPLLRRLGLMNSDIQNQIAGQIADAPVLQQLSRLDLSMGKMTDEGLQHLIDNADKFKHMYELKVKDNYLSPQKRAELGVALDGDVEVSTDTDKWSDYDAEDPYLYVSVSE